MIIHSLGLNASQWEDHRFVSMVKIVRGMLEVGGVLCNLYLVKVGPVSFLSKHASLDPLDDIGLNWWSLRQNASV